MSISSALYGICNADAGVIALLTDDAGNIRLYPAGNVPQEAVMPAATYQTIGGAPANVFESAPADNERVQIDCWAMSFDQAQSVADAIRAALENQTALTAQGLGAKCVSFNGHDYDPETKRYRSSFDWSFWLSR